MNAQELKEIIAKDFHASAQGLLEKDRIEAAAASIRATTASKPATGSIMSMIFYLQVCIQCDSRYYRSDIGGVSSPGGGALMGDIYSDDFDKLFKKSHSVQFTATPVYVCVIFFDSESNVLGTFQAGAVSTVVGTGGGTGSWNQDSESFPLTLDNKHGGTYIAHGKLDYKVGTDSHTETNKASGGLSSSIQVPKNATDLSYVVTYTASSAENTFKWPSISKAINIEVRGVWPGTPSAKQS